MQHYCEANFKNNHLFANVEGFKNIERFIQSKQVGDIKYNVNDYYNSGHFNPKINQTGSQSAWSAKRNDTNQWIQLDFGKRNVRNLLVQGRGDNDQWVKTAEVFYISPTSNSLKSLGVKNFNNDRNTIVKIPINRQTSSIKINPKTWHRHISIRVGIEAEDTDEQREEKMNQEMSGPHGTIMYLMYKNNCEKDPTQVAEHLKQKIVNCPVFDQNKQNYKKTIQSRMYDDFKKDFDARGPETIEEGQQLYSMLDYNCKTTGREYKMPGRDGNERIIKEGNPEFNLVEPMLQEFVCDIFDEKKGEYSKYAPVASAATTAPAATTTTTTPAATSAPLCTIL